MHRRAFDFFMQFIVWNGNMSWFTYILTCSDGSFYVGHTSDLEERVKTHNLGRGARFTALRKPVTLSYSETHESQEDAIEREKQIKKWSRAKKLALICGDTQKLKELSKRNI